MSALGQAAVSPVRLQLPLHDILGDGYGHGAGHGEGEHPDHLVRGLTAVVAADMVTPDPTIADGSTVTSMDSDGYAWPDISARVTTADGERTVVVDSIPSRLAEATLLIERKLRTRVQRVSHKGVVVNNTEALREAVQQFWVSIGRRWQARLISRMRSLGTSIRKTKVSRYRPAAQAVWELVQRDDMHKHLISLVGLENLVHLLGTTTDLQTLQALLQILATFVTKAPHCKTLVRIGVFDTLLELRPHLRKLDDPRLMNAMAILLGVFTTHAVGKRALVRHTKQVLPLIVMLIQGKTMEPRRHAINTLSFMFTTDSGRTSKALLRNWGWYPLLHVAKAGNASHSNLLHVASMFSVVAHGGATEKQLCSSTAVEILFHLNRLTAKFLMGDARTAESPQRKKLKHLQHHVASLMWAVVGRKDPGLQLWSYDERVRSVIAFLNSPNLRVAAAGAGLVGLFAASVDFINHFVEENGVRSLLRRASNKHHRSARLDECAVQALAQLAPHFPQVLWREHADEYVYQVLGTTSPSRRALVDIASLLLWMAKGSFGRAHRPEALNSSIMALRTPDLYSLRYCALSVWYYAHNHVDNSHLGRSDVVPLLVSWLAVIQMAESKRIAPTSTPDIRKFAVQLRLKETLVGALWLLLFDRTGINIARLKACGGYAVLADLIAAPNPEQQNVQHLVVGCLWTLSVTEEGAPPLLVEEPRTLSRCLAMANSTDLRLELRIFAAGFLMGVLHTDSKLAPLADKQLEADCGKDFEAALFVRMLKSGIAGEQEWAASMIARAFTTVRHKRSFCRLEGPVVLLQLLKKGGPRLDDNGVVLSCMHALLNLSTESTNQALIGQRGIAKLVRFANDTRAPNLRGFSTRIISNLLMHGDNRTRLYREELRVKAKHWTEEVTGRHEEAQEIERRTLQTYDSKLKLLPDRSEPDRDVKRDFSSWIDSLKADEDADSGGVKAVAGQATARPAVRTHAPVLKTARRATRLLGGPGPATPSPIAMTPPAPPGKGTVEALRTHGAHVRPLQKVLCQRVLGNLAKGVGKERKTVRQVGQPAIPSLFITQRDHRATIFDDPAPPSLPPGGGNGSPTLSVATRSPKSLSGSSPSLTKKGSRSRLTGKKAKSLQDVQSPLHRGGKRRRGGLDSPSSLAAARAEARATLQRPVDNPLKRSLSAALLQSSNASKSLQSTQSAHSSATGSKLRSKFRYHVRRAMLKRQAPSLMRIVELARIEQQEAGRQAETSFTEASTGAWDPAVSSMRVFDSPAKGEAESKEIFTDVKLRQAEISVQINKGVSARHRIQFNRSPEEASKEWEQQQLKKHLGPTVRMCLFEHVEGSTVCQGLFKHFTLPNGKTVHYYQEDSLHEIITSTIVRPPRPPLALKDIFQDTVPGVNPALPPTLDDMATPARPTIPVPSAPTVHTLPVEEHKCAGQLCELHGVIPGDDCIQLVVATAHTQKPVMEEMDILLEGAPEEWSLYDSVFIDRLVNTDSKDFYNDHRLNNRGFLHDWGLLMKKKRLRRFIETTGSSGPDDLTSLRTAVAAHHSFLVDVYQQYSAAGTSSDVFTMGGNSFLLLCGNCHIPDEASRYVSRQNLELVMPSVKGDLRGATTEAARRSKRYVADADVRSWRRRAHLTVMVRLLFRYEFIECMIRVALAKYKQGKKAATAGEAFEALMECNICPLLGPHGEMPLHRPDEWRHRHLYCEDVNNVLEQRYSLLKTIFNKLASKERKYRSLSKGSLLRFPEWERLLSVCSIHCKTFTQMQGTLAFTRSTMRVHDDMTHRVRATCLAFPDFVEAVCRVAFVSSMPTRDEMRAVGAVNACEFFKHPESHERERRDSSVGQATTRPLSEKILRLLELFEGRLQYLLESSGSTTTPRGGGGETERSGGRRRLRTHRSGASVSSRRG